MNKVIKVRDYNINKLNEFSKGYIMAFNLFGYKSPKQIKRYLSTIKTASLEDSFKETGRIINKSMKELDNENNY